MTAHNKEIILKTMDIKNKFINSYLKNWKEVILDNSTMIEVVYRNSKLLKINDFSVNPYILNNYSKKEVESITKKLDAIFPVTENMKLHNFLYKVKFHSRDYNPMIINGVNNLSPNTMNVSDYSIFQMEDNIIVFHLDIQMGIGKTISSIFKSKQLSKKFKKTIKVPYSIVLSEEEEEALIDEYENSEQYIIDHLKKLELQESGKAEQKNQEAITHPDYPKDYS